MRTGIALLVLFFSGAASAVPVQWTLKNVVLEDGTEVSGSFVFDADAPTDFSHHRYYDDPDGERFYYAQGYQSFNIHFNDNVWAWTVDMTAPGTVVEYTGPKLYSRIVASSHPPDEYGVRSDAERLELFCYDCHGNGQDFIFALTFASELSNSGGENALGGYFFADHWTDLSFDHYSDIASGSVVASVVPIPAAVWLFGSALAGLGWLRRR